MEARRVSERSSERAREREANKLWYVGGENNFVKDATDPIISFARHDWLNHPGKHKRVASETTTSTTTTTTQLAEAAVPEKLDALQVIVANAGKQKPHQSRDRQRA